MWVEGYSTCFEKVMDREVERESLNLSRENLDSSTLHSFLDRLGLA